MNELGLGGNSGVGSAEGVNRRSFIKGCVAAAGAVPLAGAAYVADATDAHASGVPSSGSADQTQGAAGADREYWVQLMSKVAEPVLQALSQRQLRARMPVEAQPGDEQARSQSTHLEAMARLLSGMAPWLENGPADGREGQLRLRYCEWARAGIASGVDPGSPDYMNFGRNPQTLVDTAFLALAMARAPVELWQKLDNAAQSNVVRALQATRVVLPPENNWLLFAAMVEAALSMMGEAWDAMRVDFAIRQHQAWFVGDGTYGDGPHFHWDYYNSFVIHPMMLHVLELVAKKKPAAYADFRPVEMERARRYAAIQERLISPEGAFPAIGRSLAYRFGAFHLLGEMSLRKELPEGVSPEQVRCALTAVMRRMMAPASTFDAKGWLRIGFVGHQPSIGEHYISTGSCYLCSAAWLPLGLAETDVFWAGAAKQWTAQKIWSGEEVPLDHALNV